jgi:putative ABC transport system permease protein
LKKDDEIDKEIQFHLDARAADLAASGVPEAEARRRARAEFGGVVQVKEAVRDRSWWWLASGARQDVRYALRTLRRSPGFATVAILCLAIGIGANTAIFSVVNALILRSLPVRDPGQLIELLKRYPGEPRLNSFSWADCEYFRDRNHVLSDLTGVSRVRSFSVDSGEAERADGEYAMGNLFAMLGIDAARGRLIAPSDDAPDAESVAVLSWAYWQSRFNGDPAVVGRTIRVDGGRATIVGVAPRGFSGLQVGRWTPLWVSAGARKNTMVWGLLGRLRDSVSIDRARAELTVLYRARAAALPVPATAVSPLQFAFEVAPARAGFSALRDMFGRPVVMLMTVVTLLLLLACTNIAGLLLARGAARQREMAVRVSLGAGRARLFRQVLTESLLLSGTGAAIGVMLAAAGAPALVRLVTSGREFVLRRIQPTLDVHPDATVLLFTAVVAVATGVLFGSIPALTAFTSAPAATLRQAGAASETRSRKVFGGSLVVAQVALSLVLLSAAGLFIAHLSRLRNVDLGFQRDSVLLVTLDPAASGYKPEQLALLYRQLLDRLHGMGGVRSATLSAVTPIQGPGASRFLNPGGIPEDRATRKYVSLNWVAPRYFETFGTPLLAGRDFEFDERNATHAAIVNQSLARYFFGVSDPIGKHFTFDAGTVQYEVVGVVADAKYDDLHVDAPRTVYLNAFQEQRGRVAQFGLRTSGAPEAVAPDVRRLVQDVLKTVAVAKVTTLDDQLNASLVPERLMATLSGFFGGVGAVLAALGLYGLLSYGVARRTNEIGVRLALGATRGGVMRMVLRRALALSGAGLGLGIAGALAARQVAAAVLHQPSPAILAPLAAAAVATLAVAAIAAWFPASRAARVDPAVVLRDS